MVSQYEGQPIALVVPAYYPPPDFLSRLRESANFVDFAVIVDDASGADLKALRQHPRVHVVTLPENRGIAAALNAGIVEARKRGAAFVLTLDQDSRVSQSYVESAAAQLSRLRSAKAPVSFVVPDVAGGAPTIRTRERLYGYPVAFDPIQSGALIPVDLFDRVGLFTEELIIDAVDSDFTVRARELGLECVIVEGTALGHSLGEVDEVRVLGRTFHVHKHSPYRTYYMVRNSLHLMRRYGPGRWRWMLARTRRVAAMIFAAILFGRAKRVQLRAVRFGISDACRGRNGKISQGKLSKLDRSQPST